MARRYSVIDWHIIVLEEAISGWDLLLQAVIYLHSADMINSISP
jgi:hypothetical protein